MKLLQNALWLKEVLAVALDREERLAAREEALTAQVDIAMML